jgi:hypothetical protein
MYKYHNFWGNKATSCWKPCNYLENYEATKSLWTSMPTNATATAEHFPANSSFIFLTDELTNNKYLVEHRALYPTIWSPSQGSRWFTNPLLGLSYQSCPVSKKTFTFRFLQAAITGPILGLDF